MRLNIYLVFFIFSFFSFSSFSAIDNKNICSKSNGTWRIFNHTCHDKCDKEIDKNTPCYKVLEYGCDCGKDKCWQNNKCVEVKDLTKKKYKIYRAKKKSKIEENKSIIKEEVKNFSDSKKKGLLGFIDNISDEVSGKSDACEESGGKMAEFRNSCADNCNIESNSFCAQVMTKSCDCGPRKCWNKTKCVNK